MREIGFLISGINIENECALNKKMRLREKGKNLKRIYKDKKQGSTNIKAYNETTR